jgi:tetratricopeptide (TPR) repeat protein
MNLLSNMIVTILQTVPSTKYCLDNIDFGLPLFILIIVFAFIALKKTSESMQRREIFLDESSYFTREEIHSQLSKFEWVPIRRQKKGESFEEIDAINKINTLLKESENRFVLISGEAGCGKTKMLYEFAKVTKKNRCVFARWNLPTTPLEQIMTEYKELPNSIKYILLDDVYRNPKRAIQFCSNLMQNKMKFILVTRNSKDLMDIIKDFNVNADIFEVNSMENINDLLEFNTEPWINSEIKGKLINIAKGNPEVLSIGHEFINQQSQDNLRFDANAFIYGIDDKRSLFDYIHNYFLENLGRAALAVISRAVIFNGLSRSDSFCKTNFKSYTKLRSLNYFYVQDDRLFFKPAILGEHITNEYYFFKEKISPAFRNLLEDANEEDLTCVLATLIEFYRKRSLSVYKDAATYLLSVASNKGASGNMILNLILRCAEEFKDAKIVVESIHDLSMLNIETADSNLINRFAIFCAKNKAYECAAKWWEKLLATARLQNNDVWITALYNNLGLVYYNLQNYEEALEWYRLAHEKFKAMRNSSGIIQSLNNLAQIYQKKQDWQHSIELYKKVIDELKKNNETKRTAHAYAAIAQIYKSNNELDKAFENYLLAMESYKKSDDFERLAQVYGNLGILSNARKELDQALNYFRKTLENMEKIGNVIGSARTHDNLALIFLEKGDIESAVKNFQLAIEKFKLVNDDKSLAQTYENLALIYQKNGNYVAAKELHQKTLVRFDALENNETIAFTFNKLGLVYLAKEEWEQAVDCFRKALIFRGKTSDLNGIEQVYGKLGFALQAMKKYDEAVTAYEQAIERMDRNNELQGLAQTYSDLGLVYYDMKDYKKALILLNQTLFFFLKQKSTLDIKKVSNALAKIQKEMDENEFGKFADAALNEVTKAGVRWKSHAVLSASETQDILKRLQLRKKQRMAQVETN